MTHKGWYAIKANQPTEKIKVGYIMERVEQYVPNLLRCYECQKYSLHKNNCRGWEAYSQVVLVGKTPLSRYEQIV